MQEEITVARRRAEITDPYGLHMRLSGLFIQAVGQFRSEIRVRFDGRDADGKSILDLMCLAAACGSRLEIEARGTDAESAVAALAGLISAPCREPQGEEGREGAAAGAAPRPPDASHPEATLVIDPPGRPSPKPRE